MHHPVGEKLTLPARWRPKDGRFPTYRRRGDPELPSEPRGSQQPNIGYSRHRYRRGGSVLPSGLPGLRRPHIGQPPTCRRRGGSVLPSGRPDLQRLNTGQPPTCRRRGGSVRSHGAPLTTSERFRILDIIDLRLKSRAQAFKRGLSRTDDGYFLGAEVREVEIILPIELPCRVTLLLPPSL
jgi:hypothetical protein